ncbi:MAG: amino acid ABC transporter substrate-binding protein [Methylobacteriaceae bacterium]|nr:amino acid ABC transporter substrate-binding protein [Methylobacteriaceae bacterium]
MNKLIRGLAGALALAALSLPMSAANAQQPVKIGFGMALSGGLAAGGKAGLLAYQIWAEEVNARGGLLGRKVDLVYYDDQSNPATVPGIYTKLLDVDKADLVMSGYATVPTAAAMPIIIQRNKLFMSLFALGANNQFDYPRYFQIMPSGPDPKPAFSEGFFAAAAKLNPKPKTVAMAGADAEFSVNAMEGARENIKKMGFQIVYDKTYPPNTIDFTPIVRAMKATNPDLFYIASYPPDSAGMINAVNEVGVQAQMIGGSMVGVQFAALKSKFGAQLNNWVNYEYFVPAPTMQFAGMDDFLKKYRERALPAGVDALGLYIPIYAYAEMQILESAIKAVNSFDDAKLADYIRANEFDTIVGKIKFGRYGEWAKSRILMVQFRGLKGNDLEQFKDPAHSVILFPEQYKSGEVQAPFDSAKNK